MAAEIQQELKKLAIGLKVRTLREGRCCGVEELSAKVGISPALLREIESDTVAPMLGTLLNIARELNVAMDAFFARDEPVEQLEFVPAENRLRVPSSRADGQQRLSYNYESLAWRLKSKHMQPFMIEFDPDVDEEIRAAAHDGEEFLHLLDGTLECEIESRRFTLNAGDSLYFYSKLPHRLKALGPRKARALAVLYPYSD
ncbi:MAG: cupin domain-containing protein [Deltaproteobacteria bacterium]|nr:cupin domain-containing protein [Deltaproteobacteria bacterium]